MKSKFKSYNKKPEKKATTTKKVEPKEVTAYDKIVENKDVDKLVEVPNQEAFEEGEDEECPCCEANCKCCDHLSGTVGHTCTCRCHA